MSRPRGRALAAVVGAAIAVTAPLASAQDAAVDSSESPTVRAMADGSFSSLTMPARVGSTQAFAWGLGGYDSSRKGSVVDAIAEVTLWGPIALRGGATYSNLTSRLRPSVGARVQILRQAAHGLDGSLSVFYKPEGFNEAEGEIETFVALAHSFDAVTVAGNLVYGQDPEGNERDGEIRATVFRRRGQLAFGIDARARFAIGAQQGKAATMEPKLDGMAGPHIACALGTIALFAEAGPSVFSLGGTTRAGVAAFGGIGTAF
jgi:hypothetical protein